MAEQELLPCPLKHHVSAGLRVSKIDPRITCLDCGLILMATDWVTLHERWQARATTSDYRRGVSEVKAVLETLGPDYVCVREDGGQENVFASLAVSVRKLQKRIEKNNGS